MLKFSSTVLVLSAALFCAANASAQSQPNQPMSEPPWPAAPTTRPATQAEAAFYGPAMGQGRQLVGLGGKCLTAQAITHRAGFSMQPCAFNLVTQRFIVDGNRLRLGVAVLQDIPNQPRPPNFPAERPWPATVKARAPACLTANDAGDLRLDMCGGKNINPAHQNWVPNVNGGNSTVNSGPFCLDVAGGNRNDGARVIAFRCNYGLNQDFKMAQASGPAAPSK